MKPTNIKAGRVYPPMQGQGKYTYSIEYTYPAGAQVVSAGINYASASDAGRAMVEEVNRLRIKYQIIEANPYAR